MYFFSKIFDPSATSKSAATSFSEMKLALIFLAAFVVLSHQQFQLPRGMIWASPYVQQYKQSFYYGPDEDVDIRPLRRQYRPSIPFAYMPNEDLNVPIAYESQDDVDDEQQNEFNSQSRIKGFGPKSNGGRLFYSSIINNPFYKTATFTITSTVTTLGSIVLCVPSNNLAAVPSPTCAGRKKREAEDFENQFPIVPSKTLALIPTSIPSSIRESRQLLSDQQNVDGSLTRPIDNSPEMIENNNSRDKRFFGRGGIAASTTLTSYSFIGAIVTSTVILDPTGANVAVCLPAGYVVC